MHYIYQRYKSSAMFKYFWWRSHDLSDEKRTESEESQKTPDPVLSRNEDSALSRDKTLAPNSGRKGTPPRSGRKALKAVWDVSQFNIPSVEGQTRFHDLDLPDAIMHAIADLGYQYCTPIQAQVLPKALAGSDATGKAQTGTGKSAAFLINIYTQLLRRPPQDERRPGLPRVLILAPTRELALQIEKDAHAIGKHTDIQVQSVFGGLGYGKQKQALEEKIVDIIVATPGRLLDFQRQKLVRLNKVEILIIDEADRMLDMGFIPDVRKIVYSTPTKDKRQTMFFSATLTPDVERLADQWTRNPVHVEIESEHVEAESVNQLVYIVTTKEKFALLLNLIVGQNLDKVLVFANRRDQTRRLADRLKQYRIKTAVLSGDIPQKKRLKTLEDFRNGKIRVLVATDVAARGLHVEAISHVINFTLPHDPEDYVHRIGRTGRAGASGTSVSFACEEDSFYIPPIEKYLGHPLSCIQPDQGLLELKPPPKKATPFPSGRRHSGRKTTRHKHRKAHRRSPNHESKRGQRRDEVSAEI
jgi:ATP-dependent RNA helicase RhlB